MWLEDIFYGALSSGVNKTTVIALNVALVACILSLILLLIISTQTAPHIAIHICIILLLAVGLLILINWFLTQIGLVKAEDQKKELFPLSDKQIDENPSKTVQDGFAWAQARAELAGNPDLAAELAAEASHLQGAAVQPRGRDSKKGD